MGLQRTEEYDHKESLTFIRFYCRKLIMLMPKKVKHRKMFRGKNRGKASRGNTLAFGSFGLQSLENGFITSRQIEAARRAISRSTKRGGKEWIRFIPHKPITK